MTSNTINIKEFIPRQDNGKESGLTHRVLGLLARMLPPDQRSKPACPEAMYLMQYDHDTAWKPLNFPNDAEGSTMSHEESLIAMIRPDDRSPLEAVLLILCYLVEIDPMTGRCIAYLQQPMSGSRPTVSLLAAMLREAGLVQNKTIGDVITSIMNTKAVQLGLVQILNDSLPIPERTIRLYGPIVLSLSDNNYSWPGTSSDAKEHDIKLPPSIAQQAELQAKSLDETRMNILVIRSASDRDAKTVASHIAGFFNRRAIYITDQDKALPALGPICGQKGLLPVLFYETGPGDLTIIPDIPGYNGSVLALAGIDGSFESKQGRITSWTVPLPTKDERREIWETSIGNSDLAERLAGDHIHGMDRIIELSELARRQAIIREKQDISMDVILESAWQREGKGLGSMAQPIKARITDQALVVRPQTRQQLQLLMQRCRLREQLADNMGITLTARYQMGVKALFTGPSGTGKTLAAGWLAMQLAMPLYRVDLASITSKYIGETEKNLSQLLGRAEQEDVVLLFDEADSLFGKRTDVKDSNDRFANAQTNYLLQRIESYTGVVVLTSNSKARFDPSFTRRLDMMIDFPLPSPEERRAIWLNHFGSFHTLSKGNINQLSVQCDLSGGHIRNVVLTAAVIAKHNKRKITMEDVITALIDEYQKLGKQIPLELKQVFQD